MPGLCPRIANSFRRQKNAIPTTAVLAKNLGIEREVVVTGLIWTLFEEVAELREIIRRNGAAFRRAA